MANVRRRKNSVCKQTFHNSADAIITMEAKGVLGECPSNVGQSAHINAAPSQWRLIFADTRSTLSTHSRRGLVLKLSVQHF